MGLLAYETLTSLRDLGRFYLKKLIAIEPPLFSFVHY
jgi:hypothetical protein